jgi:sugar/nucleoside kinase (ribokinase family)
MNMHTGELMDVIFMNEAERKMYEHEAAVTNSWIKSSKHDVTVVITLGEAGAEAYFRGDRFFCKGGDAFDAGFLDAWLNRSAVHACLERGLRSAAIVLGQIGPQNRSD